MLVRSFYFLLLLSLLPTCSSAMVIHRSALKIDVIADDGSSYPVYNVDMRGNASTHRAWLEAVNGQYYTLRVQNRSGTRIGLVIAIDGLNIISGEKSYLANTERMYILDAWQSASYDGWRTSKTKVNQFFFTDADNSYAEAWQDHSAMGVIAIAVFNEQKSYRQQLRKSQRGLHESESAPTSDRAEVESDYSEKSKQAGTGFGEGKYSRVKIVSFKPVKVALEKHFFKYEWREVLCEKGVVDCSGQNSNRFWPESERYHDYAPYPPG